MWITLVILFFFFYKQLVMCIFWKLPQIFLYYGPVYGPLRPLPITTSSCPQDVPLCLVSPGGLMALSHLCDLRNDVSTQGQPVQQMHQHSENAS